MKKEIQASSNHSRNTSVTPVCSGCYPSYWVISSIQLAFLIPSQHAQNLLSCEWEKVSKAGERNQYHFWINKYTVLINQSCWWHGVRVVIIQVHFVNKILMFLKMLNAKLPVVLRSPWCQLVTEKCLAFLILLSISANLQVFEVTSFKERSHRSADNKRTSENH